MIHGLRDMSPGVEWKAYITACLSSNTTHLSSLLNGDEKLKIFRKDLFKARLRNILMAAQQVTAEQLKQLGPRLSTDGCYTTSTTIKDSRTFNISISQNHSSSDTFSNDAPLDGPPPERTNTDTAPRGWTDEREVLGRHCGANSAMLDIEFELSYAHPKYHLVRLGTQSSVALLSLFGRYFFFFESNASATSASVRYLDQPFDLLGIYRALDRNETAYQIHRTRQNNLARLASAALSRQFQTGRLVKQPPRRLGIPQRLRCLLLGHSR